MLQFSDQGPSGSELFPKETKMRQAFHNQLGSCFRVCREENTNYEWEASTRAADRIESDIFPIDVLEERWIFEFSLPFPTMQIFHMNAKITIKRWTNFLNYIKNQTMRSNNQKLTRNYIHVVRKIIGTWRTFCGFRSRYVFMLYHRFANIISSGIRAR